MLKHLNELDRKEKIVLLTGIANNEVDRAKLNKDTLIAIQRQDAFLGLMVNASKGNEKKNVINLGEAKAAMENLMTIVIE